MGDRWKTRRGIFCAPRSPKCRLSLATSRPPFASDLRPWEASSSIFQRETRCASRRGSAGDRARACLRFGTWRSLGSKAEAAPFLGAMGLFVLTFIGLAISLFPMIVPYQLTLWEAASSPRTQAFLLVGTLFLLPVILTYSSWSYWVFRGKVRADVGYE